MSATTSKHQDPSIAIDTSRVYKVDAGQCPKCGNFKTWQRRVPNPTSGKMMPAHVTAEGYLINDGDCPYYALLRKNAPRDAGEQATGDAPVAAPTTAPRAPTTADPPAPKGRQARAPQAAPARAPAPATGTQGLHAVADPGTGGVTFTIDGKPVATASRVDALKLCSRVLDIVAGGAP